MANASNTIRTVEDLRKQMPAILERLNADQGLLLGAAANPLLALEELGYRIPEGLHKELDHRVRFSAAEREQIAALTARLHKIAKVSFDPDDPAELERLLFKQLKLPELPLSQVPEPRTSKRLARAPANETYSKGSGEHEQTGRPPSIRFHRLAVLYHAGVFPPHRDLLVALNGMHPIIEPLLEYRAIMARHAPFAPRELYDRIRKGGVSGPTFRLRARFHRRGE